MVRISDVTGFPLDDAVAIMTSNVREELGIDRFTAAAHMPILVPVRSTRAPVLGPILGRSLRFIGSR